MEVKQNEYGTRKNILFNLDSYSARPIMVSDSGIVAVSGRKVVKAGSLLDKDGVIANDATVRYVLLQDIDVTAGPAVGAGVYRGTLDLAKIESNTEVTISEDAQVALKGIIFMSDADQDYVGGYTDDDNTVVAARVTALEGVVGDAEEGLVKDLADLDAIVTTETTGLVDRVEALEGELEYV